MCLAVPGQLLSIDEPLQHKQELLGQASLRRKGKVSFGGIIKDISLAYVPEAQVGDYVIVHVGFALSIVNQVEAEQTLSYLNQLEATIGD
jgi:hydrogenase expression/formation protein HypC